ncbi:MAG: formimidoylglutamate deiminase, partial [Rhodospirillaceae bacterium]
MELIHAKQALTENGWENNVVVETSDGRIISIISDVSPKCTQVDLLLPASANLHSHAFQRAMAGLTETRGPNPRDTFWSWRHLMYRFLDR